MRKTLPYLFTRFLKIGATSWGGYLPLVAMIQKQISEKDKAIEEDKIIHAVSLASVLPGPIAVNVVAYIGYQLKGIKGALVSVVAVLVPCFLLMVALSYLYFHYNNIPSLNKFFAGVTPCIAALLLSVSFTMGKKNIKSVTQIFIALCALGAIFFIPTSYTTLLVIIISSIAGYFFYYEKKPTLKKENSNIHFTNFRNYFLKILPALVVTATVLITVYFFLRNTAFIHLYKQIILTFSGLSISQFGGGYVVIPAMQKVIVDTLHWLNIKQFADAIAMGQITPGPIYISAAFIGYKLDGIIGATVATVCIYLPAMCLMLVCAKFMNSIISSPSVTACFKGITPAVTGMIAASACTIFYKSQNFSITSIIIFFISLILFIKFKLNPVYVIPLAGLTGLFIL